jgi:solute carrier family 36 (proton-coupled amino acid transporter)
MMVPVWEVLEKRALHKHAPLQQRHILRAVTVCIAAFIAAKVPSFSSFMGLVGSSFCSLLAFILPPLVHDALIYSSGAKQSYARYALHACIVAVGVVAAVTGTIDSVHKMAHAATTASATDTVP